MRVASLSPQNRAVLLLLFALHDEKGCIPRHSLVGNSLSVTIDEKECSELAASSAMSMSKRLIADLVLCSRDSCGNN